MLICQAGQRDYVNHLENRAQDAGVRDFAMQKSGSAKAKGEPKNRSAMTNHHAALYILLVEQNREFRNRHWNFTK